MLRISGGKFKNRQIFVKDLRVKPTQEIVRQSLFNMIDVSGCFFLDVFSGSGIIGIEAISRGTKFTTFIDNNFSLCKQLEKNLQKLEVNKESYRIICNSWEKGIDILETESISFDIIFVDPFYNFHNYDELIMSLTKVVKENGIIVVEYSSRSEIKTPENMKLITHKKYGETSLVFLQP